MKLSVPANFDFDLIGRLRGFPVEDVYGKLPSDFVGGGRAAYSAAPASPRRLREYVGELRRNGIQFNYLLNSACLGNREWDRRWQRKLNRFLDSLAVMGVSCLTISTPLLLRIIKKRFPHFRCKVGIYAQVDTPLRARFWQDAGADAITLESFSINRNFDRLRQIRRVVDCELQLIANHPCLPNCPMQYYHQTGFAHASDGSRGIFVDYCLFRCSFARLKEPSLFIKSAWIQPNDVPYYESIGYNSFKLLERNIPSDDLLKRVAAYSQKRFDGNLAELILPYGFKTSAKRSRFWLIRHFLRPLQVPPWRLKNVHKLASIQGMMSPLRSQPIEIDTKKIPGDFLSHFVKTDCRAAGCDSCSYCDGIAQHAVTINDEYRRKVLKEFETFESDVTTGVFWNV